MTHMTHARGPGEDPGARPSPDGAIAQATALMASFAERTGLVSDRPPRRYLWSDAFAVCNLLGLAQVWSVYFSTVLLGRFSERDFHFCS
jgi:hypothetical protein